MRHIAFAAAITLAALSAAPSLADAPTPRLKPQYETASAPSEAGAFDPGRIGFTATFRGELDVDYRVFALFLIPGEAVSVETSEPVRFAYDGEDLDEPASRREIRAPAAPGHAPARLVAANGEVMVLNVLVTTPAAGRLVDGYLLGDYPAELYRNDPVYAAPTHFMQSSGQLADIQVSPHFTLGQFRCKQPTNGAEYLIVSERLLLKLERVLEAVNESGYRADGFTVMSGFRTPAYNASIGNGRFSRHIYGGAADVFIDTDGDGWMDDLNGDGQSTRDDAAILFDIVERLARSEDFAPYLGGLGEYGATSWRTPFVHIDERGWRARWGRPATG